MNSRIFLACVAYPAALIHLLRLTSSKLWEEHASHVGAQASPEKALRNYQHSHDLDCARQMCQKHKWKCAELAAQLPWKKAALRSWKRMIAGESRV